MHGGERDPVGAGLGLVFVRVVAEQRGGPVSAETHNGAGTLFLLSVPEGRPRVGCGELLPLCDRSDNRSCCCC
jgi:hypothetical protein